MSGFWYCKGAERELGPFSLRQLQALVEAGKLFPDTPLREKGSEQWTTAAHLDELYPNLGEPVGAAATPGAAERTSASKSGAMKVVPRAKPLVAPESSKPPVVPPAAAPVVAPPGRAVPRGQAVQAATGPAPPIPAMMPAPVMREVKPIVSVTPPGGTTLGAAGGTPRASGGNSGADDMLSIAAVGLGLVGLATFAVPYAPVVLGILGACAGAGCFFLAQKSERALGLSIGGLVLGLAAAGVGAFQMNAAATAKPPEVVQNPAAPVTPAAPVDPAAEEEARDAKTLEEVKQREQAKAAPAAETPVATQKPEAKAVSKAATLPANDPRRQLVEAISKQRWYKPVGVKFEKTIKISLQSWLSNDVGGARPAAAPAPTRRTGDAPAPPRNEGEPEERIEIPGLGEPAPPPREQIKRPESLDAPLAAEPAAPDAAEIAGKYLCLEVVIELSPEGKPLSFAGWSEGAKNFVLLDASGTPLTPVGGSAKRKAATLSPGGSQSQLFVFECPAPPPEAVQLALAGGVLGLAKPFGFEVKREAFTTRKAPATAVSPRTPLPARPAPAVEPKPVEDDPVGIRPKPMEPAPAPAPDAPPADPDGEERIAIPGLDPGKKDPIRRAPMIK